MKNTFAYIVVIVMSLLLCVITFNVCIDYTNRFKAQLENEIYNINNRCDSLENTIMNMSINRRDTIIINVMSNVPNAKIKMK